jgi:hypothetical protein
MARILWLVYERVPHPDAVAFPATEADVRFAAELLAQPYAVRRNLAAQLRRYVAVQRARAPVERDWVPCRAPGSGIVRPVPYRLAKWLVPVLGADDAVVRETHARLDAWSARGAALVLSAPPAP